MQRRLIRTRAALAISAAASSLAFTCLSSPGAPSKATAAQIDQMSQEYDAGSGDFAAAAPDWPAMSRAIRAERDSAERKHLISEFAHHVAALPESLRTQRMVELRQLTREVR